MKSYKRNIKIRCVIKKNYFAKINKIKNKDARCLTGNASPKSPASIANIERV